MPTLAGLKREATKVAHWRGHARLAPWVNGAGTSRLLYRGPVSGAEGRTT